MPKQDPAGIELYTVQWWAHNGRPICQHGRGHVVQNQISLSRFVHVKKTLCALP